VSILKVKPRPSSGPKTEPKETSQTAPQTHEEARHSGRAEKTIPQDAKMEMATLGVILQNPEQGFSTFDRIARPSFFCNKANREIYELAKSFWSAHGRLDWVGFTATLRDSGQLKALGGDGYFAELFDTQYKPIDPLDYYLDLLRDKYIERALYMEACSIVSPRVGREPITLGDVAKRVEHLKRIAGYSSNGCEQFELQKLLEFDTKHDPDCLVGYRWLNRGGTALWAGGSGYGKSSLEMQLAIYWNCGATCFGLRPVRPLKSLIVQAENDKGDTAEQIQGVMKGIQNAGDLDLDGKRDLIRKNLVIYRVIGKTGTQFLAYLDNLIQLDKPDLVWIDPMFAFAGCDLLNPEKTGRFLREGLFPIAHDRRVCINVLHHIGKPPKDPNIQNAMHELDYQYLGFGTSEIQNAFRSVNILVPVKKSGQFKLVLSKRGERSGAKNADGEWSRELYLQHSREGICWLQCAPPSEIEGDSDKFAKEDILLQMSDVNPLKTDAVYIRCYRERNASRATFYRLWAQLKRDSLICEREGGWVLLSPKKPKNTEISNETDAITYEAKAQNNDDTLFDTKNDTNPF
jgi:hypothetical protein